MTFLHMMESESKYGNAEKADIQRKQVTTSIQDTERRMVLYRMGEDIQKPKRPNGLVTHKTSSVGLAYPLITMARSLPPARPALPVLSM